MMFLPLRSAFAPAALRRDLPRALRRRQCYPRFVIQANKVMPAIVAEVIRKAPLTDEKVAFAWRLAVGPAVGKATTVRLAANGTLYVQGRCASLERRDRQVAWPHPDRASPTFLAKTRSRRSTSLRQRPKGVPRTVTLEVPYGTLLDKLHRFYA